MKITKDTYVSDILKEYGDIAGVMGVFGIKKIGGFGFRKLLSKLLTVKTAAFIHGVPLTEFIRMLEDAIKEKDKVNRL